MKRSTVFVLLLASLIGFALFQLKYQVVALEQELVETQSKIIGYQEEIHILKAEWNYLNEPKRLKDLTIRHLSLKPTQPFQLVQISNIPLKPEEKVVSYVRIPDSLFSRVMESK